DNNLVLVAGDREFAAGTPVEVEVHHEGKVIASAGDKVYFVGARGAWYPNLGQQLAEYEAVFRYPRALDLVASGDLIEERTEGDFKISRRKTGRPVRLYGFNLGEYQR